MTKDEQIRWTELLEKAVNEPGLLSKAFKTFHGYSIGNQMLVLVQCMMKGIEPGPMAGYKKWQKLGRQVQAGEKAMGIWIPITYTVENEDGEEEQRLTFKWSNSIFVLGQTDGDEVEWPETPGFDRVQCLEAFGLSEKNFDMTRGNVGGYANGDGEIAVNPIADRPMQIWIHEVAHQVLGHQNGDNKITDRRERELEAESVAMIVGDTLELDGLEYSRGYIQHWWGKGHEVSEATARRIFSAANKILEAGRAS
jgi:antirestriction protein ArdC